MTSDFFPIKNGVTHVEDVSLETIAREYGTPCYVYSANHIRSQYAALNNAIKKQLKPSQTAQIFYACKANSNLAILNLLRKEGCGLEVVSEGEYRRGLKAGISPDKMMSTGVGKTDAELKLQIETGIYNINVESIPELLKIQEIAKSLDKVARVIFRFNPNVSGGGHNKISTGRKFDKFGILEADIFKAYELAKGMSHVEALGLMVHIGSQISQVEAFDAAFSQLPSLVARLRGEGYTVSRLDIGGGFPVRYNDEDLLDLDAYARWVGDIIAPLDVDIAMEPGRFLVANSGVLLTQVRFVKESDGHRFLILDSGMNDLIRPAMYESYHHISPIKNHDAPIAKYDVVGPICETGDTFSKGRELPAMQDNDFAIIQSTGAYGAAMNSNYNTRPRAAEVLVDGSSHDLINARETYEDLMAREIVPPALLD